MSLVCVCVYEIKLYYILIVLSYYWTRDSRIAFCFFFCSRPYQCVVFVVPRQLGDYTYEDHLKRKAALKDVPQRIHCPKGCGRSYMRLEHLKRHIGYECGVEPKYQCQICERKFVYNFSMKKHMVLVHKKPSLYPSYSNLVHRPQQSLTITEIISPDSSRSIKSIDNPSQ